MPSSVDPGAPAHKAQEPPESQFCTMRSLIKPRIAPVTSPPLITLLHLNSFTPTTHNLAWRFKNPAGNLPSLVLRHSNQPFKMADSSNGNGGSGSVARDYAEIVVVRHGETMWNAEGRIQGHLDVELNDIGRQQAAAVADRLSKEPKISAVYSSDLKRALETAQTIANSCDTPEVIQDPDLRERHLGDLQGLIFREAPTLKTKAYQAFLSSNSDQDIPGGGESLDKLYQRCTSALQKIGRNHIGERVVVVTHGGVVRALYKRASPNGISQGKIQNTSVNIFHLSENGSWVIKTWNDVSHLSKTGFLENAFGGDKNSG